MGAIKYLKNLPLHPTRLPDYWPTFDLVQKDLIDIFNQFFLDGGSKFKKALETFQQHREEA
jgi:hypothetical protein